jgi:hypothetical protein
MDLEPARCEYRPGVESRRNRFGKKNRNGRRRLPMFALAVQESDARIGTHAIERTHLAPPLAAGRVASERG